MLKNEINPHRKYPLMIKRIRFTKVKCPNIRIKSTRKCIIIVHRIKKIRSDGEIPASEESCGSWDPLVSSSGEAAAYESVESIAAAENQSIHITNTSNKTN